MKTFSIPKEVIEIAEKLENSNFETFLVGGCVRDLILGKEPKDWDFTTNAGPEEIQNIFPDNFYNNKFGTVTIKIDTNNEAIKNIEVTPYRIEGGYSDSRHPDEVSFAETIEEDLKRRDFAINAIAYNIKGQRFVDPHKGQDDIKDKTIRAVGDANKRISEDALRMMRAVRFVSELGFTLNIDTKKAIEKNHELIQNIATERVRDELTKLILSDEPRAGIELMEEVSLLQYIIPELREGLKIKQNQAHSFEVFEHNVRCLQHAANRKWSFHVRLSALLHDVAKPHTRAFREDKGDWTFYGHDVVGARFTKKIMTRLKYSKEDIDIVTKLVRYHLFFSDVDKITMSAVRRLVSGVGKEYVWELMNLRACDRIGTGRPKEAPYRLRKYESMIEEAMRDPISVGMLKIDGNTLIKSLKMKPGPKVGFILHALLEEVLDDPSRNTKEFLEEKASELLKLSEDELKSLGEKGKGKMDEVEEEKLQEIRKRHWVK